MRSNLLIVAVLIPALMLAGCGNVQDDAFAHAMKSGNARMAVSRIQPGQARLRIHEANGRVYYPIHYSIVRGDSATTFALLHNGSPTTLDGRSLAFNAARVNQTRLAQELARAGYGSQSDINAALAANRRHNSTRGDSQAMAAATIVGLMWLLGNSGNGGSSEVDEYDPMRVKAAEYDWNRR